MDVIIGSATGIGTLSCTGTVTGTVCMMTCEAPVEVVYEDDWNGMGRSGESIRILFCYCGRLIVGRRLVRYLLGIGKEKVQSMMRVLQCQCSGCNELESVVVQHERQRSSP